MIQAPSETRKFVGVLVLIGLVPLVFPFVSNVNARLATFILIYAMFAIALNIVFGHVKQLYLFIGGLTGIGAYTTAITADAIGVTPYATLLLGGLLAGLLGLLISYVSARRRFTVIVVAVVTLSLQLALMEFFVGARWLTGGSTGIRFGGLELEIVQSLLGIELMQVLYWQLFVIFALVMGLYFWMTRSKIGLAFEMIRQDEYAATAIGVNVVQYKSIAGFTAAFIIGFVGPFYGQLNQLILPGFFEFTSIDLLVLMILIVGGLRTLYGPIVGAIVIIYLNEELRALGQWRLVAFGVFLTFLFLYFDRGLVPYAQRRLLHEYGLGDRIRALLPVQ